MKNKVQELNYSNLNMLVRENLIAENIVKNEIASKSQFQQNENELRIIFQFPPKSAEDESVKSEIKSIMASALQEQLHTMTS